MKSDKSMRSDISLRLDISSHSATKKRPWRESAGVFFGLLSTMDHLKIIQKKCECESENVSE